MSWWILKDARSGVVVAQLNASHLNARQADRIGSDIATLLNTQMARSLQTARANPTLVHHGKSKAASWHVVWAVNDAAMADLYTPARSSARAITQAISDIVGAPMKLLDNVAEPRDFARHRLELETARPPYRRLNPKRGGRKRLDRAAFLAAAERLGRWSGVVDGTHAMVTQGQAGWFGYGTEGQFGPFYTAEQALDASLRAGGTNPLTNAKRGGRKKNPVRRVRTPSPLAGRLTADHERARDLTEAWARGMAEGGHNVTPDDYAAVYKRALAQAKRGRSPKRGTLAAAVRRIAAGRRRATLARKRLPLQERPFSNPGGRKAKKWPLDPMTKGVRMTRAQWNRLRSSKQMVHGRPYVVTDLGHGGLPVLVPVTIENPSRSKAARARRKAVRRSYLSRRVQKAHQTYRRARDTAGGASAYARYAMRHISSSRRIQPLAMGHAPNPGGRKTFAEWMAAVDAAVQSKVGASVHDLIDAPFADWYEAGVSPKSAASRAIRAELGMDNPKGPVAPLPAVRSRQIDILLKRARVLFEAGQKAAAQKLYNQAWEFAHKNPSRPKRRPKGRIKKNPRSLSERARAENTYRRWSELEPGHITRVTAPARVPRVMAKLGELVKVVYRSDKYDGKQKLYEHTTRRPRPVLATDPEGRDVFVVGGHMRVTGDGLVN